MTDRCCTRILLNSNRLGLTIDECRRGPEHDWLDDGGFCCLNTPQWKRQSCHCGAARWTETAGEQADRIIAETERETGYSVRSIDPAMLVVKEITREDMDRVAGTVEQIRKLADQTRRMPPLSDPETP